MSLEATLERIANATERVAQALESRLELVKQPDTPSAEAPKRGRPRKEEKVEAPVAEPALPVVATPLVTSSFLDDEPAAQAEVVRQKTPEEYRSGIRKALQELQTLTTPEHALGVLKAFAGVEVLAAIPLDKMEATLKASADAVNKAKARTA